MKQTPCLVVLLAAAAALMALPVAADDAGEEEGSRDGLRWMVTPMVGWDRNELTLRGAPGAPSTTTTDTGPEYGLFAMMMHPNLVINNFIFYSDVNDTDVWGDLLFANYYVNSEKPLTWNAGVGYLYHEIKPDNVEITVNNPMVKTGPRFTVKPLHLSLNPYLGYAWEQVDTEVTSPRGTSTYNSDNDSILYGITAGWRWRMLNAAINYYYQDSQDLDEDFQTVRARFNVFINENWGIAARVDYMEHQYTKDTSVLFGPTCVF